MLSTLLERGFRPFFLLATLHAVIAAVAWLAVLQGWLAPPALPPGGWHAREMLFGFAGAVIAGFLLTAVRNWTGLAPGGPGVLASLVGLWLLGRALIWLPATGMQFWAGVADIAFLSGLALAVFSPIRRTGNRRNYLVAAVPLALAAAYGVTLLADRAVWSPALGLELAVLVLAWLMALMSGRVVPFFTERRLGVGISRTPRLDGTVLALLGAALLLWVPLRGEGWLLAALLIASAMLILARQFRWKPLRSRVEPLLWVLQLGHLWLAAGLALLAISLVQAAWLTADVLHALMVGALGTLTLGMMTRVALGHTGRALQVTPGMALLFLAPTVAAGLRLLVMLRPDAAAGLLAASLLAWALAFAGYALRFTPILVKPRVDAAT